MNESLWPNKKALYLLNSLNQGIATTPKIGEVFTHEGYDLLQSYQALLFMEIETFVKNKNLTKTKPTFFNILKNSIAVLFLTVVSIISYFITLFSDRKVLIYSGDQISKYPEKIDNRLSSIYQPLFENKIPFVEIYHATTDGRAIKNFFSRLRPAIYLEGIENIVSLINFFKYRSKYKVLESEINFEGNLSEEERKFLHLIVNKYLVEASRFAFKEKFFTSFLKRTKITVFFTIDDLRYYSLLIVSSRKLNIASYAFQHGHFTKYHVGWLQMTSLVGKKIAPDFLLVWSDYWKKELLRLGTYIEKKSIVIAGYQERTLKITEKNAKKTDNKIGVLIPREARCPYEEVKKYTEAIINCPNTEVFFKLRAGISTEDQLKDYNFEKGLLSKMSIVTDLKEVIDKIDVVAGTYSTLLYDMIAFEKPVIIFETSSDYGEGMVLNGMAQKLSQSFNICTDLRKIAETPLTILKSRKLQLFGKEDKLMNDAVEEILKQHSLIK